MVFVYARPDADTSTGSWKNQTGGAALFSAVDETSLDDADYIVSAPNTFNDACKLSLSNVGIAGDPATVRYRYRKYEGDASTVMGLHVELLQGVTVIAEWDHDDISASFVTAEQTLTTPQFNSITDFRDLYLSFTTAGWWLTDSSVDLDFQTGRTWNGSTTGTDFTTFLSCSRASVGYATNSDGTLTQFASNQLRIGTGSGLLIEDSRTNIAKSSQDVTDGSNWNITAVTLTANATSAPDGTTTADSIIETVTGVSEHYVRQSISTALSAGLATWSAYFKPAGRNYALLLAYDDDAGKYVYVLVNLLTGGTSTLSSGGSPTNVSHSAEILANGWIRARCTMDQTAATPTIGLQCSDGSSVAYAGDGSSGVYAWGAQVEQGAFVSSYIPTTTAAATRAADNITTSSSLQTVINAATGSVVAQVDGGSGSGFAANIVDSNGTNLLGFNASNNALASMIGVLATSNTANRTTQDKLGLAWSAGGRSLVLNGGTVATDASAQTPSATQHVGSSGSANFAYAYVERLTAWTTKLADATLQGFT